MAARSGAIGRVLKWDGHPVNRVGYERYTYTAYQVRHRYVFEGERLGLGFGKEASSVRCQRKVDKKSLVSRNARQTIGSSLGTENT